eukprot:g1662.t1
MRRSETIIEFQWEKKRCLSAPLPAVTTLKFATESTQRHICNMCPVALRRPASLKVGMRRCNLTMLHGPPCPVRGGFIFPSVSETFLLMYYVTQCLGACPSKCRVATLHSVLCKSLVFVSCGEVCEGYLES